MNPTISVVMATYNRARILRDTLEAMTWLDPPQCGWELIVIDNASSDDTQSVCEKFSRRLPLRYLVEARRGKYHAVGTGIAQARGNLLVFTDDDINPVSGWLSAYVAAARRWPAVAGFGGPVHALYPEGTAREYRVGEFKTYAFGHADFGDEEKPYEYPCVPAGANMALRADLFREQGYGFNPRLGPRGNSRVTGGDIDLPLRLVRDGRQLVFVPSALVRHRIQRHQATWHWLLKRAWQVGRGSAHIGPNHHVPTVFGFKRYLLGAIARDVWQLGRAMVTTGRLLTSSVRLSRHLSELLEKRRLAVSAQDGTAEESSSVDG